MSTPRLLRTLDLSLDLSATPLGRPRRPAEWLVHLSGMDTNTPRRGAINENSGSLEPSLTLSQLAARLCVSAQTIYDLGSQGRRPRGLTGLP